MGLLDFFSKKPAPVAPSGGLLGGVPSGQQQMSYREYAEAEMMKGRQPLPLKDWQKLQAEQAAQKPK
jgi:hypothetical protein